MTERDEKDPPAGPPEDSLPPGQLYRWAWVFYLLLSLAGVAWVGSREGTVRLSLFVDDRWPAGWPLDLALGAAAGAALLVGWWVLERGSVLARELTDLLARRIGPLSASEALGLAILSGFAEEFFFRGAVQGSWGPVWATILFAVLHSGRQPALRLWTVFALAAGTIFALLVIWRGTLLAAIVAHVLVNAVSLRRVSRRPVLARREVGNARSSEPEDGSSSLLD